MKKLTKISQLVKEILTDIPETRNSDGYLYIKVLERVAQETDNPIDLQKISVPYFFCNVQSLNCPYYPTVTRARRKVQEKYPELKGNRRVQAVRQQKEEAFRAYANANINI